MPKSEQLAFNFPDEQEYKMTIQEAAEILSVSQATVRNWIKSGLLTPRKVARKTRLKISDVTRLKQNIEDGKNKRLRSRRNKRAKKGHHIPPDYVSYPDYLKIAEAILDIARQMDSELRNSLVLAELSLKLLAESGKAVIHRPQSATFIESVEDTVHADRYQNLVRGLIPSDYELSENDSKALLRIAESDIPIISGEDFLGLIYMALSNLDHRKLSGSYYTPSDIVDGLVKDSLESTEVTGKKVIDPCCGSGNFILKVFLKLKQLLKKTGLSSEDAEKTALANIFGCDIDPLAILLCKVNLALATEYPLSPVSLDSRISQRDSLLYRWETGAFDLVIGNPPWGFAFSQDQLADLEDIYTTAATGESFSIFIELGLKLLGSNGTLAYVLPQSILNVKLHEPIRRLLLSCTQIEKIDLIGDSFCGVYAPALTLTAKKTTPSPSHNLEVLDEDTSYEIPQDRFIHNDSAIFNVTSTGREQEILEKMKSIEGVMYLEGNAKFALGIVTGNNKKFVHKAKPEGGELILRGSDIFKYNFYPSENYIIYDPDRFQQVAPTELYRAEEKLIYRFINEQLICAYDDKQTLTLNSANIVIPHIAGYSIKYILAILNSRCAQFFFKQSFSSVKVLRRHLESIPIPPCSPELQRQIIGYVDKMLNTQEPGMREELYDSIEGLVSKVYTVDTRESRLISRSIPENVFLYR